MKQWKHARLPGSIGQNTQGNSSQWQYFMPGPIGIYPAPKNIKKIASAINVKKFQLPALETDISGNLTKNINEIDWPLYSIKGAGKGKNNKSIGLPQLADVKQGAMYNCPLAAILAALAHTPKGQKHISNMITEHNNVSTEVAFKGNKGDVDGKTIVKGKRYFTVKFVNGRSIDVSSVFYTDEQKSPKMIYMKPPTNVLWPCVIEKAYAKMKGGYDKLGNNPKVYWEEVVGKHKYLDLKKDAYPKAKNSEVLQQVRRAGFEPMIASLEEWYHGFAVIGLRGKNKIVLLDPDSLKEISFTLKYLREVEETVFWYGGI